MIRGKKPTCAKFKWAYLENPVKRDKVEKDFKILTNELKKMKHIAHEELLQEMPLAYAAGFVDGDGCILYESDVGLYVGQKYRAICDAFSRQFGGTVSKKKDDSRQMYYWKVWGEGARLAFQQIGPFLKEKKKQREVIIQGKLSGEAKANIKINLSALKGHQLGRLNRSINLQIQVDISGEIEVCENEESIPK